MTDWKADKRWSDRFLTQIKRICGEYLIGEPPVEEDQERNTDLVVLRMDAVRIACRVRKNKYLGQYGDEFTIRCGRPSGVKTELTKIVEGWGDYVFYGFADAEEQTLAAWLLGDLRAFRVWFMQSLAKLPAGRMPGSEKPNADGSSHFMAFAVSAMPKEFIVARHRQPP